jgi:hypothetical protein
MTTKTLSVSAYTRSAPKRPDKRSTAPHVELEEARFIDRFRANLTREMAANDDNSGADPRHLGMI